MVTGKASPTWTNGFGPSGPGNPSVPIALPPGMELAISVDTLVSGVHFPSDTPPVDVGYKALAVNLSDLAAMGASPGWAVMSLTIPRWDEDWLSAFYAGLGEIAGQYGVRFAARNVGAGPLAMTIQIHGQVPCGQALRRDCAAPGELVFVTGALGDAGLALETLAGEGRRSKISREDEAFIHGRLARPTPRVAEGMALRGIASAAIDISDGLVADLSHIVEASSARRVEGEGLQAVIDVEKLPLSPALRRLPDRARAWRLALSSGDDYELCFTVAPDRYRRLQEAAEGFSCPITCIGHLEACSRSGKLAEDTDPAVRLSGAGLEWDEGGFSAGQGYRHFGC